MRSSPVSLSLRHSLSLSLVLFGLAWTIPAWTESVEDVVLEQDASTAFTQTTQILHDSRASTDFPSIVSRLRNAYAGLAVEDAANRLAFRLDWLSANPSGLGWFDTGVLALAHGEWETAAVSFGHSVNDEECCKLPETHVLLGIAKLESGDVGAAKSAFETAVGTASGDEASQIRRHVYEAYLDQGDLESAEDLVEAALGSADESERQWARDRAAVHAWKRGDKTLVEALAASGVESTLSNEMAAADLEFKAGQFGTVKDRLVPLLSTHPLGTESPSPEVLLLHLSAHAATCLAGDPAVARTSFEALLPHTAENSIERVKTYCWLGYSSLLLGDQENARTYYELGLTLDGISSTKVLPPDQFERLFIRDGKVSPTSRAKYVHNYRYLQSATDKEEGK